MYRIFGIILIVITNLIMQSTLAHYMAIGGITMNMIVIMVVSFAMLRGKIEGAIIGFSIGLLMDIFFGNVIGYFALLYMYIGFFCGYIDKNLYKDNIMIPIMVITAADLVLNLSIYLFSYMLKGKTGFFDYFLTISLPEAVYTCFGAVFLYKLYQLLNTLIEDLEKDREEKA